MLVREVDGRVCELVATVRRACAIRSARSRKPVAVTTDLIDISFEPSLSEKYVTSRGWVPPSPSGHRAEVTAQGDGTHQTLVRRANLRPIRLPDVRHTALTLMALNGVPMAVVAAWAGHADPAFTLRVYAHSQDDAVREAGSLLTQMIWE